MKPCPCCSNKTYQNCCYRFIAGGEIPATPEELMRSRYTAYTLADMDYIGRTMQEPASLHFDAGEARKWSKRVTWLKLDVLNASQENDTGVVEFMAHYYDKHKKHVLHEISNFRRDEGQWFYIDGTTPIK